jgi:succinoglycan biosynthesis protein ExoO
MTTTSPLVSIVMPAHNAGSTIERAIDSVIGQTYARFEILVVDDRSDDETATRVGNYDDPRIRLLKHRVNRGVAAARNTALRAARGDFITLLDADDAWLPERLARLLVTAQRAGPRFFVTDDTIRCLGKGDQLIPWVTSFERRGITFDGPFRDFDLESYLDHKIDMHPLVPARALQQYRIRYTEGCSFGEDVELYCRLLLSGLTLRVIPDALYMYRVHSGSLSTQAGRAESMVGVWSRLLSIPGISRESRLALSNQVARAEELERNRGFSAALKAARYVEAARLAARHPALLLRLIHALRWAPRYIRARQAAMERRAKAD